MQLDYDLEKERILRRRKVAEAMLAQSQVPMGGTETVGGIAVRRSPFEGIAKVAQAYAGTSQQNQADEEARALGQRQRDDVAAAVEEYHRATSPQAARELFPEEGGPQPARIPGADDKRAAAMSLMGKIGDPKDAAKLMVAQALAGGSGSFGKIEPKDYTPESVSQFNQTGDFSVLRPRPKVEFVNGQAVDPHATAPGTRIDQAPTEIERELLAAGMQRGSPEWTKAMADRVAKQTTHQPPTALQTVEVKQEGAEKATVGKGFGEQYIDIQKAGLAANTKLANLDRMQGLLDGVNTGKLTPAGTELAAYAKSLGFNVDPKLGNKQAADALSKDMALSLRNPAGGAGMPGALSDSDRRFLEAMVAGLGKDPEANKLIIDGMRALAKRDAEVAQIARDYRQKNGQLDEGFYNELSKFSAANPLFSKKTGASGGLVKNPDGTFTYTPGGR